MKKLIPLLIFIGIYSNVNSQAFNAGTHFTTYTDISPDSLLNTNGSSFSDEVYTLDLFTDAMNDIKFDAREAFSSGGSDEYISVGSINPNVFILFGRLDSVYVPASTNWNVTKVAKVLNAGDQINTPGAIWASDTLYLADHSGHGGGNKNVNDWIGSEHYIGLKYQNGVSTAYGWIRVQCVSVDSCYVKDFSATLASVGINELTANETSIYPNPISDYFYLSGISLFDSSKLKIVDLLGKEISFTSEMEQNKLKIDLEGNVPFGCYVLQYFSGDQLLTKKLVKVAK